IYGFDLQATKYVRVWKDVIFLADAEASTVDVWDKPEFKDFFVTGRIVGDPTHSVSFNELVPTVPIFDRLYLGGSNNLRGFRFRDISPKDFQGQPLGGQSMARGTVELTFPIIEKARGAIFYDAGLVNPDPWDFGDETLI